MTIEAKIIADSISPAGIRLTTFQLRYPRFIHAEELTHRILETTPEQIIYEAVADGIMYDKNLSRNASSSRAIPVNRMIEDLRRDPAMPIYWGSNKPGMQADEELFGDDLQYVQNTWFKARDAAIIYAEDLMKAGLHKQIANRILEPWAHINVVVTATDWENFFALRRHKDAQPELKALADLMHEEMRLTIPHELQSGDWHLPYVKHEDHEVGMLHGNTIDDSWLEVMKKVSVARCARVSYLTHDGRRTTVKEDLALFERLVGSQPLHASPAEHQATPDEYGLQDNGKGWAAPDMHGNLRGWIQLRKQLPNEFIPG